MFVGHLAVALTAPKVERQVPLPAAVAATFALDLLWPLFLLLGIETVRVDPGNTAFTHLAFEAYPWSHSLLVVIGGATLATLGGKAAFGSWRAGAVLDCRQDARMAQRGPTNYAWAADATIGTAIGDRQSAIELTRPRSASNRAVLIAERRVTDTCPSGHRGRARGFSPGPSDWRLTIGG